MGKSCRDKRNEGHHNQRMTITTLKAAPHLHSKTLLLIENAFHYEKDNHFSVDFAPLLNERNFHNCFIKIDQDENVIAHIGVCEKEILGFPMAMLGGIAVDESHRGEGHFQELMTFVLSEKKSDVAFILLWSDQEKLYKKFGFHLCGTQIEVDQTVGEKNFYKTKLNQLNEKQLNDLKLLYRQSFQSIYTTIERTDEHWQQLSEITSADLYYQEDDQKMTSYFFMNKGQDLDGIIFEYGTVDEISSFITKISSFGKVWLGSDLLTPKSIQYQFFMAIGSTRIFSQFIKKYTRDLVIIRDINSMKQVIYFDFQEETLELAINDFLLGLFGPGIFEEMESDIKPIFISGIDSI
jgi:predicted N-acetyltransferase YhbS